MHTVETKLRFEKLPFSDGKRKDVVATIVTTEELTLDDIKIIAHYGQKVIGGPSISSINIQIEHLNNFIQESNEKLNLLK